MPEEEKNQEPQDAGEPQDSESTSEEKKGETVNPDDFDVETYKEKKEEETKVEGVDEEDQEVIKKVVKAETGKTNQQIRQLQVQSKVDRFISDNPDMKKYRDVIIKYKTTPRSVYQNVPVEKVAKMVAYEDAQKMGAKKEREANQKVKKTKGGGTSRRKGKGGEKDWMGMSKEEYKKEKAKVLGRGA